MYKKLLPYPVTTSTAFTVNPSSFIAFVLKIIVAVSAAIVSRESCCRFE
jgi:hypothetical protein